MSDWVLMKTIFCLAEDRAGAEIGLKLAILSAHRHCPDVPVVLYRPDPIPSFIAWLKDFPNVRLVTEPLPGASSWNCKPQAMLPLLDSDPEAEVVWIDSDLILAKDPRLLFRRLTPETLGITQEPPSQPDQGTRRRTEGWGFTVGNARSFTMNSCVVRVTRHHRRLLERWLACLNHPQYIAYAKRPLEERPLHYLTDQDVLNAIIGSEEFVDMPLGLFVNGRDVLHSGGALAYSISERLRGLFLPIPTFVHAIAIKPWMILGRKDLKGRWWWWRKLHQEISPYVALAREYQQAIQEPAEWMTAGSLSGRLLRCLGFGHWSLRGLPVTVLATLLNRLPIRRH